MLLTRWSSKSYFDLSPGALPKFLWYILAVKINCIELYSLAINRFSMLNLRFFNFQASMITKVIQQNLFYYKIRKIVN